MDISKWYIISYINDIETTAGGVRPARLNKYLNEKGYQSTMITRVAVNKNEVSVAEPFYSRIPFVNKFLSPDFGIVWANKVSNFFSDKNEFVLLTTSPLHSVHKVGLKLKSKKKDFIWIADFRDPFTLNSFYNPLYHKKILDKIFEKKILRSADVLIFNTALHEKEYKQHYPWLSEKKCLVVRNGYDMVTFNQTKSGGNRIIYSGGIYKGLAITGTGNFFRDIASLGLPISADFIGEDYQEFKNYKDVIQYKGKFNSADVPEILSGYKYGIIYLPGQFKNSGRVPTKLYDYIGAGLIPVCINASIEMKIIIDQLGYGICIDEFDESSYIKFIELFNGRPENNLKAEEILTYSRNYQFDILIDFMKNNFGKSG